MGKLNSRKKVDILILFIVLIVGYITILNAKAIGDWWHFLYYEPPTEVVQLSEDAGMSETGKRLFYRYAPIIGDGELIEANCGPKLGCAVGRNIYILRGNDPEGYNTAIVTASHEMPHIAYDRLPTDQKQNLNNRLEDYLRSSRRTELENKLEGYPSEDRMAEVHSFVGSEVTEIPAGLENHYAKYFDDRSSTTDAYKLSPEGS